MKILLISDEVHELLYSHFKKDRWQDIDLILSAGDLKADYLSFLVTLIDRSPLYYVKGNHDTGYDEKPPEGCININGKIVKYKGLNILGLEGSKLYNGRGIQYTEKRMKWNVFKLLPKLLFNRKIDIVLTHAPPAGVSNMEDRAHQGFKVFNYLIDKLNPDFFIHGHTHLSYGRDKRIIEYNDTKIINAYKYYILEI